MKNHSQCLLCYYVFGRTCKKNNEYIPDVIYKNEVKCENFKAINEVQIDCEDSCCSENKRYESLFK